MDDAVDFTTATAPRVRIVLADDHELVLEGLRSLLTRESDFDVIATATDGEQLLNAVRAHLPDLVVMDWQMPPSNGLQCLIQIRRENLPVKVLILSAFGDTDTLRQAWDNGADGFALKTNPPRQTVAAIRNVAHGQTVFPRLPSRAAEGHETLLSNLSDREREFLALVAEGMTNSQIAERLTVTEHTVKFHLQNIFQKLGVANRTEAARLYHRKGR
jgi:DNA-binding NarL/FixJ family response regulator